MLQKQWHIVNYSTTGISNQSIDVKVGLDSQTDTLINIPSYSESYLSLGNCLTGNSTMTFPWYGDFAEVIVFNRILTSVERASLELYLKNKYGL